MSQLIFNKRQPPSNPSPNKVTLYIKPDGNLYIKRDNGLEEKVSGKASLKIEPRVVTQLEAQQKKLLLEASPIEPDNISVILGHGGGPQINGLSYELLSENIISWSSKALDGFIEEGDVFIFHYLTIV
jgi:hypothetical protein